jgi:hypothetical protein
MMTSSSSSSSSSYGDVATAPICIYEDDDPTTGSILGAVLSAVVASAIESDLAPESDSGAGTLPNPRGHRPR